MAQEGRIPLRSEWTDQGPRLVITRAALDIWKREEWEQDTRRWWGRELPT